MKLKERISENLALKILSIVFALLLWAYVRSHENIEMNFVVPLELRNLPSSLVISTDVVKYVDIQIRGKEPYVRDLASEKISVYLDLSKGRKGENRFRLSEANATVPSDVKVTKISPKSLTIRLESKTGKKMSIEKGFREKNGSDEQKQYSKVYFYE
ncbi:MAG TPA: CdaR family protein [Nitrospiria bacterium]|jgi:YbbR domain-containing protein